VKDKAKEGKDTFFFIFLSFSFFLKMDAPLLKTKIGNQGLVTIQDTIELFLDNDVTLETH